MHTLQYIATRAASAEEAASDVENFLTNSMGDSENISSWYDWFVIGGGRWSPDPDSQYNNTPSGTVQQGTPKFEEALQQAEKFRQDEYANTIRWAREKVPDLEHLLVNLERDNKGLEADFAVSNSLYPLHRLYKMTSGCWDWDSYFFDSKNDTMDPRSMREGISSGETDWWLVPVDFHF